MSTDLVTRQPGQIAVPQGARALGQRVKPIIRLGMGIKDPERGFPRKTDHFTVRGDERACAKFKSVYGEQPKAVKIMVPSELGLSLDISYRAFIGGGEDGDGRPLALGLTNFATLGYVGGPDVLRVWKQDGSYAEVETLGLDELGKPLDEIANDLQIAVHATFTFTIPEVLGWGSFAAITSKGKKSADNLSYKLTQIYGAFGSKAPFAFEGSDEPPMLVLKPDTAMMRFEDKSGKARWGKTDIFVLDIVIPESLDKMLDRLAKRQEQIAPAGAAAALYPPRELETGSDLDEVPPPAGGEDGTKQAAGEAQTGAEQDSSSSESAAAPPPAAAEPDEIEGEAEEVSAFKAPTESESDADVQAANEAAEAIVPFGKHKGTSLKDLVALGDEGAGRIRWALKSWKTEPFLSQVWAFSKVYAPDIYTEVLAEREAAS